MIFRSSVILLLTAAWLSLMSGCSDSSNPVNANAETSVEVIHGQPDGPGDDNNNIGGDMDEEDDGG